MSVQIDVYQWVEGCRLDIYVGWDGPAVEERRQGLTPYPDFREFSNMGSDSLAAVHVHSTDASFSSLARDFDPLTFSKQRPICMPMVLLYGEGLPESDRAGYWVPKLIAHAATKVTLNWHAGDMFAVWMKPTVLE